MIALKFMGLLAALGVGGFALDRFFDHLAKRRMRGWDISTPLTRYIDCTDELGAARKAGDEDLEDQILDRMDLIWETMSERERTDSGKHVQRAFPAEGDGDA